MKKIGIKIILIIFINSISYIESQARIVQLSLIQLSGSVSEGTAIFRADLSSLGIESIRAITLHDSNSKDGGSPGQYSGFDLDAIKLSNSFTNTASEASLTASIDEFAFDSSGILFTPGTQREPKDPKLNGTNDSGQIVDNNFATLESFDGVFFGTGSVTLGDGGSITFNLNGNVSVNNLYLYIGEVGVGPGEAINGSILVSDTIIDNQNLKPLVYVPLDKPCRIVDTRGFISPFTDNRTIQSFRASGSQLELDPQRDVDSSEQLDDCQVISTMIPASLVANITAVSRQYKSKGNLVAYPTGSTTPDSSLINFQGNNIANSSIISLSSEGNFDVKVQLFGNEVDNQHKTDVIVDAIGYFYPLSAFIQ